LVDVLDVATAQIEAMIEHEREACPWGTTCCIISGGNRWHLYSDEHLLITHFHSGAAKLSVPARERLHALIGPVVLEPRDEVLWAHPPQTQKASLKRGFLVGCI
jgi:hypothetical protein